MQSRLSNQAGIPVCPRLGKPRLEIHAPDEDCGQAGTRHRAWPDATAAFHLRQPSRVNRTNRGSKTDDKQSSRESDTSSPELESPLPFIWPDWSRPAN